MHIFMFGALPNTHNTYALEIYRFVNKFTLILLGN